MAEEFSFKLDTGSTFRNFFYSQYFGTPSYPTKSFSNQFVICTGSNIGLGFEAARHFYRLNCAKLILAVRSVAKGQTAKEDIVRSVKHRSDAEAIEIWPLDLSSTQSTLAFSERVKKELPRVDVVVENAGVVNTTWQVDEGFERTIQVNVISTYLLALSLLPKLTETAKEFPDSRPHLEIVSSGAHQLTKFKQLNAPDIYAALDENKGFSGFERYNISKLIEVLFVRELVSRLDVHGTSPSPVTITLVNPGMCYSAIGRNSNLNIFLNALLVLIQFLLTRTTEVGSRTLVHGANAGLESHGEFMSDGKNEKVEKWIYSDTGKKAQVKVFEQAMKVLEARRLGIGADSGLKT